MHFWSRGALFSLSSIFPTCGYFCGGLLPPDVRPGAPIHILQCRCRCRCRCLCRCRCRFRFRCRCYPCGYFRGGRVKESDGECCSQGGVWARPGPGAGPPAQVRPAGAGPAHQARRRRSGPPAQVQARRRRSGPPDRCLGLCFPSRETKSRTGLSRGCPPRGLLRVQGPAPVSQLPRAPAPLLAF